MAGRAAPIAIVPSVERGCRLPRPGGRPRSGAPALSDRSALVQCATPLAARRRRLRDAEIVGGEVSWPPSLQCGRCDALFRLDIGGADYLRPLGGIRLDDDSKLLR